MSSNVIVYLLLMVLLIFNSGLNAQRDPNETYLIIVSDKFINSPSLATFIEFRQQEFNVIVTPGTEIGTTKYLYREYIRGIMPAYLLLVGEYGDFPIHYLAYPKEVESYNFYVASSLSDHPQPDIPMGLFFAEDEAELSNLVNKTIAYHNDFASYPNFFYGHAGSIAALEPWPVEFNEEILTEMYARYFGPEAYQFSLATAYDDTENDALTDISMINTGIRYMIYHGHGNISKWSFGMGNAGISQLANNVYPIIFSFACLTGTFSGFANEVTGECFAQKITASEHGAVAFVGAYNTASKGMNQLLEGAVNALFNDTITNRIGDVMVYAYQNTINTNTVNKYYPIITDPERIRSAWQFHLFGDPALPIFRPAGETKLNLGGTDIPSAGMVLASNEAGLLIPRLSDVQRDALKSPAAGLCIFNTNSGTINFWNGNAWMAVENEFVTMTTGTNSFNSGIAINLDGAPAASSALLDIQSLNKGLLIPVVSPDMIVNPVQGLFIYNILLNKLMYYNGADWLTLSDIMVSATAAAGFSEPGGVLLSSNSLNPHPSAILDLSTADKGLLLPRMNNVQRDRINPQNGLIIFNTTSQTIQCYTSTGWYQLATSE